jgi:hypothetical protein
MVYYNHGDILRSLGKETMELDEQGRIAPFSFQAPKPHYDAAAQRESVSLRVPRQGKKGRP